MRPATVAMILLLGIMLLPSIACVEGSGEGGKATATATATLGPVKCDYDRDAINAVLRPYYAEHGEWPTADGQPGDIDWDKLVPEYLPYIPKTDNKCQWGIREVDGDPPGKACIQNRC